MDPWGLAARVEITDLMARYVRAADRGRSQDLAALFTDDGILAAGDDEVRGPTAIAAYLDDNKTSLADRDPAGRIRHHVSSLHIELTGPTSARATCYFLAITGSGPDHWGRYRDELRHDGTEWRFVRRAAIVEGAAPGSWAETRRQ
ncbi:MAG TPA: nuclear transport factor 2 family protein [Acidimicrobiia bacterium]|nr:nuclear transport factor 2 family protein [Acidimicrobiia bacterium]